MLLGTLIERLSTDIDAAVALEALDDVVLFAQLESMASRFEESAPEYVAASASRFAAMASDEDWLGLMSDVERATDPAQAVLVRMVRWGLKRDADELDPATTTNACGCGGGGCG